MQNYLPLQYGILVVYSNACKLNVCSNICKWGDTGLEDCSSEANATAS